MKAVIPAAGLGTRFLPATKAMPKEMLPVVDKPAIQYVVEEAVASGIREILIVTGRGKRAIEDHFDRSFELERVLAMRKNGRALSTIKKISGMANIHYVRQKEQRGLGDALLCAKTFVGDEPFAVMLGDDIIRANTPCIAQLLAAYRKSATPLVAIERIPHERIARYGIVEGEFLSDTLLRVKRLLEKPSLSQTRSTLCISGRYILTPDIFECIRKTRRRHGEIQLTDALQLMLRQREIHALMFEGRRYDIGDKVGYIKAILDFSLERKEMKRELLDYLRQRGCTT